MIIYIAGKITGDDNFKNKFANSEWNLKMEGHSVLNPAKLPAGLEYEQYMNICFAMLAEADCIYLLNDYRDSPGALRELDYAKKLGKKIKIERNEKMSEEQEIYVEALEEYGEEAQITMVFEEMAELQKELCKYLRKPYPKNLKTISNIAEEVADVEVMLEQMKLLFKIEDAVKGHKTLKTLRLRDRLRRE